MVNRTPVLQRGPTTRRVAPPFDNAAKRGIDLVVSLLLLTATVPLLAVLAFAVRLTSPGPALFRQVRVGRGGKHFVVLKFRTMVSGADQRVHQDYVTHLLLDETPPDGGEAGVFKLVDDPRVTRVGRWLRQSSLDELPQLINVLTGSMSLVGPRPALPYEVALFEPRHLSRHLVRPGITGLWQVSGRSALSMRDALDLDLQYVQRHNSLLDLSILARTVPVVLMRSVAR